MKRLSHGALYTAAILTRGEHCRWVPGTERLVMNIVAQRSKNTVPDSAAKRRMMMHLRGEGGGGGGGAHFG